MDSERLEQLLTRYWNCETSLEEEQELRTHFREGVIPDSLKETKDLFRYFEEQKKKSVGDFSFNVDALSDTGAGQKGRVLKMVYNTMRIAAGIAVLMVAVWFVRREVREETRQASTDTYEDPKLAFEETKKALLMISKSFGKAEEQAKNINLFNEAQEEIKNKEKDTKL